MFDAWADAGRPSNITFRNNNKVLSHGLRNRRLSMQSDKNFLSRPSKDVLRKNENGAIANGGTVTFTVKYIGCIEVYASMKVLDFQTRSLVARWDLHCSITNVNRVMFQLLHRECIHRVCDATNVKIPIKRNVEKRVQQCISVLPCLEHAGIDVALNISSRCVEIKLLDTNEVIARHEMPRISFASGGDAVSFRVFPSFR